MSRSTPSDKVQRLLNQADIRINGNRPWDIRVENDHFYRALLCQGSLGLGESYMAGWWDSPCLDQFFFRVLRAGLDRQVRSRSWLYDSLKARLCNLQKPSRAFTIGRHHYDIGNDLYKHMLDRQMVYSCAYWEDAETLDQAQEAKLHLVCHKLGLEPGMRLLDIGCGWGGTARFAAEHYGVEVVGVTVSAQQVSYGRQICRGLPVDIRLQDYRDLDERFDRIVSIGMFEHVGFKNYATYMKVAKRCLKDDGLFLLHTIGGNRSQTRTDPWIARYIFPNSMLPSARQIGSALEGHFVIEDWHNFGPDYDRTLLHWFANFHDAWDTLKERYDDHFYRMWKYYLLASAGAFRARSTQLWQLLLSPLGLLGGHRPARHRLTASTE